MKEFADNNSEFYEHGGKFSRKVENAMGKGLEISLVTNNFAFSNSVFRFVIQTCKNHGLFGKGLTPVFTCLQYKRLKNTVGKGEIAHEEQFLLFPQCFLPFWKTFYHLH